MKIDTSASLDYQGEKEGVQKGGGAGGNKKRGGKLSIREGADSQEPGVSTEKAISKKRRP